MTGGWFVFTLVGGIVLCSGVAIAVMIMRAAWAEREKESLTSSDLRALEESAVLLIEQLKSEADRGIAELDKRCAALRDLITEADRKIDTLSELGSIANLPDEACVRAFDTGLGADARRVIELSSSGMSAVEIARVTGLDCADVNLALSLGKLGIE
jgi:hypothetical protein